MTQRRPRDADHREVTLLAGPSVMATSRATPTSRGRVPRAGRRSLGFHALLLGGCLAVGLGLVRPYEPSISDEGAVLAQVHLLEQGGGWFLAHPLPGIDPTGSAFAVDLSSQRAGTLEFAPMAKHPVYPLLLVLPYRLGGVAAALAVSLVGTLLAAVAAALLARRIDPRAATLTLWITGAATPLFNDSYLLIAHTLGAAAVGFAVLCLTSDKRRPVFAVATGLTLLLCAQLVRNEAVLFGAAFGVVLVARGVRGVRGARGDTARGDLVRGGAVLVVSALGYLLDAFVRSLVVGSDAAPFSIAGDGGLLAQRWRGFVKVLVGAPDGSAWLRMLLVATLVFAVFGARRRGTEAQRSRAGWSFAAAGACACAAFVVDPGHLVPGLLLASPVLLVGLVMLDRAVVRRPMPALLAATALLFTLAVFATQYSDAGNAWGGRFLAVGLPVVTPLASIGLIGGLRSLPRASRRLATVGVVAMVVAMGAMAIASLVTDHRFTESMRTTVAAVTARRAPGDGDPRPVVLAGDRATGRLLWSLAIEQRWLTARDDDVVLHASRLRAAGVRRLVVITADPQRVIEQLRPWYDAPDGVDRVSVMVPFGRRVTLAVAVVTFDAS